MASNNTQITYREKVEKGLIKVNLEQREAENKETGEKVEVEVLAIYTKRFNPEDGSPLEDAENIVIYDDLVAQIESAKAQLVTLEEVKKDFDKLKSEKK